jgi:type IV pilus assembly protein PilN
MAKINLLPWREELRAERKRQFFGILGLAAVVGVLVSVLVHLSFEAKIEQQNNRNDFLQSEITKLDAKINEIDKLEKQKQELLNRMQIVQSLQQSRPLVVRLFDELVRQIPTGVHLTSFTRKGAELSFQGISESTPRVSAFMRNIEDSEWLSRPDVSGIKADTKGSIPITTFNMTARETKLYQQLNKNKKKSKKSRRGR